MQLDIEIDGQGGQQCSALVEHRGAFIILNESRSGWVSFIECLDRQAATGQDQGRREGMRREDIMEKDDGEEEEHSLYEYVGRCV